MTDATIARYTELLRQIDELQVEWDKLRRVGDVVQAFRARVEALSTETTSSRIQKAIPSAEDNNRAKNAHMKSKGPSIENNTSITSATPVKHSNKLPELPLPDGEHSRILTYLHLSSPKRPIQIGTEDSAYASTTHNESEHALKVGAGGRKHMAEVQPRPPTDEGYASVTNKSNQCEQSLDDL